MNPSTSLGGNHMARMTAKLGEAVREQVRRAEHPSEPQANGPIALLGTTPPLRWS